MGMRLQLINDPIEIRQLLAKDELYKPILGIKSITNYIPTTDTAWFKGYNNENELIGLCCVKSFVGKLLMFHCGLYKNCRNQTSLIYLQFALTELRNLLKCQFIMTINEKNIAAQKLAEKAGFILKTKFSNSCQDNSTLLLYGENNG